jgi:hypothetical protein
LVRIFHGGGGLFQGTFYFVIALHCTSGDENAAGQSGLHFHRRDTLKKPPAKITTLMRWQGCSQRKTENMQNPRCNNPNA